MFRRDAQNEFYVILSTSIATGSHEESCALETKAPMARSHIDPTIQKFEDERVFFVSAGETYSDCDQFDLIVRRRR